jgi:hypothetical protein
MAAAKRLLDDLLTLEINTLVKPGMTGRKMPPFGHAMIDIFCAYDAWLSRRIGGWNAGWEAFSSNDEQRAELLEELEDNGTIQRSRVVERTGTGGEPTLIQRLDTTPLYESGATVTAGDFSTLRERARDADTVYGILARYGYRVEPGDDVMLVRITRNCDQLKAILERSSKLGRSATLSRTSDNGAKHTTTKSLSDEDMITVRKAWDMGTEVVALQTVVQLDGDIVTRINEAYTSERARPVRELHREGVSNALEHWKYLVDTVKSVVGAGLSKLTG